MKEVVKKILSRLLSEELGRQEAWCKKDKELGMPDADDYRNYIVRELTSFMDDNDIDLDKQLMRYGYQQEMNK